MNDLQGRVDTRGAVSRCAITHLATSRLTYLIIALIALLPRLIGLGRFVTLDEINFWIKRSHMFLQALEAGNYAGTAIWAQPGVTTMWLGSVGILLERVVPLWSIAPTTPFAGELFLIRLPVVLTHVAGILVGFWFLRRLLAPPVALLAALLWAADPFIIGYSRLLHVDALAATFITLSLLALSCYWYAAEGRFPVAALPNAAYSALQGSSILLSPYALLIASGSFAALAVLSKSPALALLPVVGAVVVATSWRRRDNLSDYFCERSGVRVLCSMLLVWGIAFGVTIVLVWPAVWADVLRVYELLRAGVADEGAQPHPWGNFFLGQPVNAPGPLFYPVALALRLTPWTMLGIFLLGSRLVEQASLPHSVVQPGMRDETRGRTDYRTIVVLGSFVILFIVAMSLFPKKFNRYLIPAFPSITILAAVGLAWGMEWLSKNRGKWAWNSRQRSGERQARAENFVFNALLVLCGVIVVINVAWWNPYCIAYYNPLLGGAPTGARTFVTGWGEGLDQVAAWLNAQPDITGVVTASTMINSLQPLMRSGAQLVSPGSTQLTDNTGYVVVYIRQTQRGPLSSPFDQFYPGTTPLHTVRIHGVEYAWIYQVPPPIANPITAEFGAAAQLKGYEVDTSALRSSGVLSVTLQWHAPEPVDDDVMLFMHVLDTHGQQVGQVDVPPAGPYSPTSAWQPGRVLTWVHPLPMPADIPPGDYWLSLGLYHPDDFTRLELRGPLQPGAPDDGAHALLLPIELP